MGGSLFRRKKNQDSDQLDLLLRLAQSGDDDARNRLIEAYIPFILRTASQATKRYIDRRHDDEYSVAMLAMNEAIDRYEGDRNVHFIGFAQTIIRRRLIDYFRSQKQHSKLVPWTEFDVMDEEDHVMNFVEVRASLEVHDQHEENAIRKQEIVEYTALLGEFGLSFAELVDVSPKHTDARQSAIAVAKIVATDDALRKYVFERQALPLKALEKRVEVSRKTMERQRKYILAVVLLLCGDFQSLQSYVG